MIHAGEVMVGGIEMRAVVGADGAALDGRVFTAGELVEPDAHVLGYRRGGLVMVHVFDLRQRVWRVTLDPGLPRRGDVGQTTRHGASLSRSMSIPSTLAQPGLGPSSVASQILGIPGLGTSWGCPGPCDVPDLSTSGSLRIGQ